MAFLITCAGSKKPIIFNNLSDIENLSFNNALLNKRVELLELTGINLDWSRTLPAWELYSGRRSKMYPQVLAANWNKQCADVKILSALFGWISHTDLIPTYDLSMSNRAGVPAQPIWRFWLNSGLLNQFVTRDDVDLLSVDYRKAVNGNRPLIAKIPEARFTDYGVQKGRWLNSRLNNLIR